MLVYCCKQDSFFKAVQLGADRNQDADFVPATLSEFLTRSVYSPLFCVRTSRVFSFHVDSFLVSFERWIDEEKERSQKQTGRIDAVAILIFSLLENADWAVNSGLIVYDCLDDEQKLIKRNG